MSWPSYCYVSVPCLRIRARNNDSISSAHPLGTAVVHELRSPGDHENGLIRPLFSRQDAKTPRIHEFPLLCVLCGFARDLPCPHLGCVAPIFRAESAEDADRSAQCSNTSSAFSATSAVSPFENCSESRPSAQTPIAERYFALFSAGIASPPRWNVRPVGIPRSFKLNTIRPSVSLRTNSVEDRGRSSRPPGRQ